MKKLTILLSLSVKRLAILLSLAFLFLGIDCALDMSSFGKNNQNTQEKNALNVDDRLISTSPVTLTEKPWIYGGKNTTGYYSLEFKPTGQFVSCYNHTPITSVNYPQMLKNIATVFDNSLKEACYNGTYSQTGNRANLQSPIGITLPNVPFGTKEVYLIDLWASETELVFYENHHFPYQDDDYSPNVYRALEP